MCLTFSLSHFLLIAFFLTHSFFSRSTFQADVVVVISSYVNKTEFLFFVIKNIVIIFVLIVIVFPVVVVIFVIIVVVVVAFAVTVRRRR